MNFKNFLLTFIVYSSSLIVACAQSNKHDTVSSAAAKVVLQGCWTSPNGNMFFLFKGDSVKEWESEGADSSVKPYCSYSVGRVACDSASAHVDSSTGLYLTVTCGSEDYQQVRCYYIKYIDAGDLKLGFQGQYDPDSGEYRKVKN